MSKISGICFKQFFIICLLSFLLPGSTARADLWADYSAAVEEASREATPDKISRELIPIASYNQDLVWRNRESEERELLMSTWGDDWYPSKFKPGDDFTVSSEHLVWVTTVPELKSWTKQNPVSPPDLTMRIRQLLGMPPDASKTLFVEFWVRPDQLFRPSPDPEISDREAELDFPSSPYFTIDTDYQEWFNDLKATQYIWPGAMPWTRLGYTYDWGNPESEIGLSEFIIKGGTTVKIHSMTQTSDYCATMPDVLTGGDYNGDGSSDIAVFKSSSGQWAIRGVSRIYFGTTSDIPVPGDYNGDGITDVGIFRPGSGLWAIRGLSRAYFGSSSDIVVPGDYDGDGNCDLGIFRPSIGLWAIREVTRAYFGASEDRPVPADYTGDGIGNIAIFRRVTGLWAIKDGGRIYFGGNGDIPIPGDYNGDGTGEAGIFRPENGLWLLRGVTTFYYGGSTMDPVPLDLDGDSTDDAAVWQGSLGLWSIKGISRIYFGLTGNIPVTR
jgi:hypothetical protein